MDHTHYARWLPIQVRDMVSLCQTHPGIADEFCKDMFTVQKTRRVFSEMAID